MALTQAKIYTEDDYYNIPEDVRAELIDGQIYYQSAPNRIHQKISSALHICIGNYINAKGGSCEIYSAPFAVKLFEDSKNILEPDISVICDPNKLTDRGCNGAPDWIIEITSPSNPQHDYGIKRFKYRTAGVREYWIVNPEKKSIIVYDFEHEQQTNQYSFEDTVPVCIYEDLKICIDEMLL